MQKTETGSDEPLFRQPSAEAVVAAWEYRARPRQRRVYRTISLKLHNPSPKKVNELLWAQIQVTNFTSEILEALGPLDALRCIHLMLSLKTAGDKSDRVNLLGEIIDGCFRRAYSTARAKKYIPPARLPMPHEGTRIAVSLRSGACREIAKMLLGWYARLVNGGVDALSESDRDDDDLTEPNSQHIGQPDDNSILVEVEEVEANDSDDANYALVDPNELFQAWKTAKENFETAGKQSVPIGRHIGQPLGELGRRDLRWLNERLINPSVVEETLAHLEVLRSYTRYPQRYTVAQVRQARQATHPWRRRTRSERALRAGRMARYELDPRGPRVLLRILSDDERDHLESELQELKEIGENLPVLRSSLDILLNHRPPRYPSVQRVMGPEGQMGTYGAYVEALTWMRNPYPRNNRDTASFTADELADAERPQRETMLQEAKALREPELQPLSYKRLMRPPGLPKDGGRPKKRPAPAFLIAYRHVDMSDKALDRRYRFLPQSQRAVKIANAQARGPMYEYSLLMVTHGPAALIGEGARQKFVPQGIDDYYYVDFPETPVVIPEATTFSIISAPLECGWASSAAWLPQSDRILSDVIDAQSKRQHALFEARREEQKPAPIEQCLPGKGMVASMRIVSRQNERGHYEFYARLPVAMPAPILQKPERMLGIHEHAYGYSYAIVQSDGAIEDVGDLFVPAHVIPTDPEEHLSDNYAYEVARAIVTLAITHHAQIALENTTWIKKQAGLDRTRNRMILSRPSAKIMHTVRAKAKLRGLVESLNVRGVSLQACGACGHRLAKGVRAAKYVATDSCPRCNSHHLLKEQGNPYVCHCWHCGTRWQHREAWYICGHCDHRSIARFNTAIVVARLGMEQMVRFHQAAQEREAKRKKGAKRKGDS